MNKTQLKMIAEDMNLDVHEGVDGGVAVCAKGSLKVILYGSVEKVTRQAVQMHHDWINEREMDIFPLGKSHG